MSKKIWVGNYFGSKKNGSEFFLCQTRFGSEIFWGKKNGSKNFLCQKRFGSEIILGKKKFGQIFLWQKRIRFEKKFGSKKIVGQIFFVRESSSWVKIGLHAENQLPGWSGSGLKVTAKLNNNNTEFLWWWWWVVGGSIPII